MNFEQVLPWLAICISAISLMASFYNTYRDRSKLRVFSEVVYDCSKDQSENLDNPPPYLRIYAVNVGKRAITLKNLNGAVSKKSRTSWALIDEPIVFDENGLPSIASSGFVQDIGVRLNDGDIYEFRIKHDDYTKLYSTSEDCLEFKKYFFMDVLGNQYLVKDSEKGIKCLLQHKQ